MKKAVIVVFCMLYVLTAVSAQGFYFDIGIGSGLGWTIIDGENIVGTIRSNIVRVEENGVDLSIKTGYGPFGNIPLYAVAEWGGIGHRIATQSGYMQFNSYLIGPGVIWYLVPIIQLGASIGYSYTSNVSTWGRIEDGRGGLAWNISAAIDGGIGNHGVLVGLKYFNAINTLELSDVRENALLFSLFLKYTYRKKMQAGS